jgi:hypothetical protein
VKVLNSFVQLGTLNTRSMLCPVIFLTQNMITSSLERH